MSKYNNRHYLELLWEMIFVEIKATYKKTKLGLLWTIINPLIQMIVVGTILKHFTQISQDNYYKYLITGLLPWQFFSLSISSATSCFIQERHLLHKGYLPKILIPLKKIFTRLIHFLISFFIMTLVLLALPHPPISITQIIFQLIGLIALILIVTALGTLVSTINVFNRDMGLAIPHILQLLFYTTPIIYLQESLPTWLHNLLYFNPLTLTLALIRSPYIPLNTLPSPAIPLYWVLIITLIVTLSYVIIRNKSDDIVDYL